MSSDDATQVSRTRRFFRRRWSLPALAAFVILLLLGGLWLSRLDIAEGLIDRALRQNGVQASYEIEDVGFRTQKIRNLVIGDPDRPDLTAKEVDITFDLLGSGTDIVSLRAVGVRLWGRLEDGKLRLGELDKLRDLESDAPFELPAFYADLDDIRIRLDTPAGPFALALSGRGRLDDGFRGALGMTGRDLAFQDCSADGLRYAGRLATDARRPSLDGRLMGDVLACPENGLALDSLTGSIDVTLNAALSGIEGKFDLGGRLLVSPWVRSRGMTLAGDLNASFGDEEESRLTLDLRPKLDDARLADGLAAGFSDQLEMIEGTPLQDIGRYLSASVRSATRRFDAEADMLVTLIGDRPAVRIDHLNLLSDSGALFRSVKAFKIVQRQGAIDFDGDMAFTLLGGGFPNSSLTLSGSSADGFSGKLDMDEMVAGNSMLTIEDMRFAPRGGQTRLSGAIRLSGPVAGGQLDNLRFPVVALVGAGRVSAQPGCFDARIDGWRSGNMNIGRNGVRLCPDGSRWMVDSRNGSLAVSARAGPQRLAGRYENGPAALSWRGLRAGTRQGAISAVIEAPRLEIGQARSAQALTASTLRFADSRIAAANLSYAASGGATNAAIDRVTGAIGAEGRVTGELSGFRGEIANVPVDVSDGAGRFSFFDGALVVDGGARVAYDADSLSGDESPVFRPVRADALQLRFAGNIVTVTAPLILEETGNEVATLDLSHDLSTGTGEARFLVDDLRFDKAQQPFMLFPAFYGTVSAVRGSTSGEARIAWNANGVRSGGRFALDSLDLAAPFGPVKGLSGTINFTDLLGLETAPGQRVTLASVNPGIEVLDGLVTYQLLPNLRVRVEGGEWPFAGGRLVLRPSIIDLTSDDPRYLSFYIDGLDAAQFVADMQYENITATGIFDGELPMVFDDDGGRIDEGQLLSRPGGGSLAYLGELSYEDMGAFANFAFDALKSIRYSRLEIIMNGRIDGEILTQIQFSGLQQGDGAARNFITRQLAKLPIEFNINISAPFMQLIGTLRGLNDPTLMVGRNLPALLAEQERQNREATAGDAVQPSESPDLLRGREEK